QEHQRDSTATWSQNYCSGGKPTLEEKHITLSFEVEKSSSTPRSSQRASCSGTALTAEQEKRPHSSPRG
ncbi:hypothetical protein A2U01_0092207, partial [Trifolium medium]|nr:hypothetical protein [Trifolium medium]